MAHPYAKFYLAVVGCLVGGLFLSAQLVDYKLTSGFSRFRFSADTKKAVRWVMSAAGLDTNSSHRENPRATLEEECPLTPPAGVLLPNNTMFFTSPCRQQLQNSYPVVPETVERKKIILVYNRPKWLYPKDYRYKQVLAKCGLNHACALTDDRSALTKADAVMVHIPWMTEVEPYPNTTRRSPRQIWIAYFMESPANCRGTHDYPAWKGVFNWTLNYRTDSDIFDPYSFLTLRSGDSPLKKNYTEIASNKTKPLAWFVSNCRTQSRRRDYVDRLMRHIDVDIYGACGPRNCSRSTHRDCLRLLNTTYHFYLSFENSLCRDYVTEKMFQLYNDIDVIQVVRGAADLEKYFPPNTYINTAHFESPKDLAAFLKRLAADPEAYARMLRLKDHFRADPEARNIACKVCRKLYDPELKESVYPDLSAWMNKDEACQPARDV